MTSEMCGPADLAFWVAVAINAALLIINSINSSRLLRLAKTNRESRRRQTAIGADLINHVRVIYVERNSKYLEERLRRTQEERNYWRDLWKHAKRPPLPASLTDCLKDNKTNESL